MGRGLVHRFLWLQPGSSRVGHRTFDTDPTPQHVTDRWTGLIKAMLSWSPASSDEWGTTTHIIKLSTTADARFRRYQQCLERDAGRLDQDDPRRAFRLKWAGRIARIAGVIHCLEVVYGSSGHPPHDRVISDATMAAAIGLGAVMLDHADAAMGTLGQDMDRERALRVAERVRCVDGEISSRDLWKKMRMVTSLFDDKSQFDKAVTALIRRGYLKWRSKGKSDRLVLSEAALEASPEPNWA